MWYERRAEDAEMFVRLKLWARYAGKATRVALLLQRRKFQLRYSSRARHPSMLYKQPGSTPGSGSAFLLNGVSRQFPNSPFSYAARTAGTMISHASYGIEFLM